MNRLVETITVYANRETHVNSTTGFRIHKFFYDGSNYGNIVVSRPSGSFPRKSFKIRPFHMGQLIDSDWKYLGVSNPIEINPRFYYYRVCSDQENVW